MRGVGVPSAGWIIDRYCGPLDMSERGAGFIEGYAAGLVGVTYALTGEPDAGKSYDPMTVRLERGLMCSYVFNMKDGGRTHPLSQYATFQEIADQLLLEALDSLAQDASGVGTMLTAMSAAIQAKLERIEKVRPCPWCEMAGCYGECRSASADTLPKGQDRNGLDAEQG